MKIKKRIGKGQSKSARIERIYKKYIRKLKLFWAFLRKKFRKFFASEYGILLDTHYSQEALLHVLFTIRQLKQKGHKVRLLYWLDDTKECPFELCNDCQMWQKYQEECNRKIKVVLEILSELTDD